MKVQLLLIASMATLSNAAKPAGDKVMDGLPGLQFDTNFDSYAGYLSGGFDTEGRNERKIFYWLTEYTGSKAAADVPVILWLNGGPGCSSLGGLFTENGPFRVNPGNKTLYENVFAWNKVGHVLYIESPPGIGFSFINNASLGNELLWDDDQVADMNANALNSFFSKFSDYASSPFYITGESYAGIYIPTLAARVVGWISGTRMVGTDTMTSTINYTATFANHNFKGFAIGNGYLNQEDLVNSLVEFQYYHGVIGNDRWSALQSSCCSTGGGSGGVVCPDKCNYYAHIKHYNNTPGDYWSDGTPCGDLVQHCVEDVLDHEIPDPYNMYQSCYKSMTAHSLRYMLADTSMRTYPKDYNQETHINYDSTDHLGGAACFADGSTQAYLNRADVQRAIHVDNMWRHDIGTWRDCNDWVYWNYTNMHKDTSPFFHYLAQPFTVRDMGDEADMGDMGVNTTLRMLIYNGDIDTVCNFLGDEWFTKRFAHNEGLLTAKGYARSVWRYRSQLAGYVESLGAANRAQLDILTINGAGHFVPLDRAGPALQMIANFVWSTSNYTTPTGLDITAMKMVGSTGGAAGTSTMSAGLLALLAICNLLL